MSNILSHSAVSTYLSCGKKYDLQYNKKLRGKYISGALLFGSSIDQSLNHLLKTKNLDESIAVFDKSFRFQEINKIGTYLPYSLLVVYAEKDFDIDLLLTEDIVKYQEYKTKLGLLNESNVKTDVKFTLERKKQVGFKNLEEVEKKLYNYANWLCLYRKGHIMLKSYSKKVMPKIKDVLAIQKKNEVINNAGDKVVIYLDLVVEFNDGSRYLLDNKTSSREYEKDSAGKSQQLILYYSIEKDNYDLHGVGFVVLSKHILKNKVKICSKCQNNGSGGRHKTCDILLDGKRCNGIWMETVDPECRIDVILNKVTNTAEQLVIDTFDHANEGIKKQAFGPNLSSCGSASSDFQCQYRNLCWNNDNSDLVDMKNV